MKIWNDENANRKSSRMPCKIPRESVSFLLPGKDITDVGVFKIGTKESLRHLHLKYSVYIEEELSARVVCWLDMLSALSTASANYFIKFSCQEFTLYEKWMYLMHFQIVK